MKEKELIIASRIHLKYTSTIVGFCLLMAIFIVMIICFHEIETVWIIFSVCMLTTCLLFIMEISVIYKNNSKSDIMITYCKNYFTIYDKDGNYRFHKNDVLNMNFKNKVSRFITPYYYSSTYWNYGKFIIYITDPDSDDSYYKIVLKNMAEPDKVYDKMAHILEWDIVEN